MGLAYTIDTPVKVAKYGIDSVISIIEDKLIELMRQHYYHVLNLNYKPITPTDHDYRARRITDYLNLVNSIVRNQFEGLKNTTITAGSEISKYLEMLPTNNVLRLAYDRLMGANMNHEKDALEKFLKSQIRPGRIDVNIMTKVDKNNTDKDGNVIPDSSDALAALRGYANSDLKNSGIIFSAGLNPRLFNYLEKLSAFAAKGWNQFDKKIIIKVSDFRSALIQGKYLAKKGLWVSEFRVESGLNCGGHAFATGGSLLGPILQEFKDRKHELITSLHTFYNTAIQSRNQEVYEYPHQIDVTVQGGIGTCDEAQFLQSYYGVASTGWGTPFLLCPEATTVDEEALNLLQKATESDILLSKNSPLGIRFNYLRGTSSEKEKLARIAKGKPGSPCTEKHLVSNTEFTDEPICTAAHSYQKRKIEQLNQSNLSPEEYQRQYNDVVSKECLCVGLSNSAIHKYELPPIKKLTAVTICPGPNIAYFNKQVSLRDMTDHIYGRNNILSNVSRPHMFIKELQLNIDYLNEQAGEITPGLIQQIDEVINFGKQLISGIEYYRSVPDDLLQNDGFKEQLLDCEVSIGNIMRKVQSLKQ